ncbi:MAG TPA: efflux RND transporter periplasmic adaptor subunit [Usitatibacter sp.]|jgi:multidrug efflux system membrane fusion protein|nr:efflux RND transporter periplasmic adaptor subunit [Usitatibacter sp.]
MTATTRPRNWKLVAAIGAITAGAIITGVGIRHSTASPKPQAAGPAAIPVSVATVEQREVTPFDEFSGRLEAVDRVEVRPRVAGAIQSVHFTEGALVRSGDLLLTIDPAPFAAEVDRAQAQVAAAQARLDNATTEQARAQRLWDERAIAQRELDERVNARRQADADVRAAQAALQIARLNLGYTQVRAPVSGRVGKLEVTVGNLVAAGASAPVLTTLVSVSPIYASFDADEGVVARALREVPSTGSRPAIERIPVDIGTDDAAATLHGRLQLIDNQVNTHSGTVRVRAVFDNRDGRLMAGQFVRVHLGHARSENAVLVTDRAIGTDQSKRFVMVVGGDNKVAYREVKLGPEVEGLRIVNAGLKPGERIVVNGLQRVRPGAVVAPQEVKTASR